MASRERATAVKRKQILLFQGGRQQAALSISYETSNPALGTQVSDWIAAGAGPKYNLAGAGL